MKVAILGSGPGGMTTAKVLTDAGLKVTVFEQGDYYPQAGNIKPYSADEMDFKYADSGLTAALGDPPINYVEASCLGGGSEINSGLYHRIPSEVLNEWGRTWGLDCLNERTLENLYLENEKDVNVCLSPFTESKASSKLKEGAEKLGWSSAEIPRWFKYIKQESHGKVIGLRQSMTETYLKTIDTDLLEVRTGSKIVGISEDKSGVKLFIKYLDKENTETHTFDTVFLACGAINTPWLLKKSKLGPPKVGSNLRMHSTLKVIAKFEDEVTGDHPEVPVRQVKEFWPRFSLGGSISSHSLIGLGLIDNNINPLELRKHWQKYAIYYAMVSEGSGQVYHIPYLDRPVVTFNLTDDGLTGLSEGLVSLGRLLFAADANLLYASIRNSSGISSVVELNELAASFNRKDLALMTIHLMGTCAMGDVPEACVEIGGRLKGSKRIYIADASIIPTALGVNPQGTVMALARYNANDFIGSIS